MTFSKMVYLSSVVYYLKALVQATEAFVTEFSSLYLWPSLKPDNSVVFYGRSPSGITKVWPKLYYIKTLKAVWVPEAVKP